VIAPGTYACASCGSPLTGTEKFCGVCGGPSVAARVDTPSPAGKVCGSCGTPVSDTTKFCGGCGAPVGASFPAAPVAAPAGGEEILGIIPNARKMKMMGMAWDTYTIVITGRRMVLAQLTQAMLNTAIAEAQARAKAEGKGFFGVWGDQMAASFGFARRYETLPPDVALAETPGNLAINNARITAIKVSVVRSNSDDGTSNQLRLNIESGDGRFEYIIPEDDRLTTLLKNVYGDRVSLPFGLFKAGPVRIKFF
jgi:RNA polymerase subunit RPABC4/transcription elongation factor Spt4